MLGSLNEWQNEFVGWKEVAGRRALPLKCLKLCQCRRGIVAWVLYRLLFSLCAMAPLNRHTWQMCKILLFELIYSKVELSLFWSMHFSTGIDCVTITCITYRTIAPLPKLSRATDFFFFFF